MFPDSDVTMFQQFAASGGYQYRSQVLSVSVCAGARTKQNTNNTITTHPHPHTHLPDNGVTFCVLTQEEGLGDHFPLLVICAPRNRKTLSRAGRPLFDTPPPTLHPHPLSPRAAKSRWSAMTFLILSRFIADLLLLLPRSGAASGPFGAIAPPWAATCMGMLITWCGGTGKFMPTIRSRLRLTVRWRQSGEQRQT